MFGGGTTLGGVGCEKKRGKVPHWRKKGDYPICGLWHYNLPSGRGGPRGKAVFEKRRRQSA